MTVSKSVSRSGEAVPDFLVTNERWIDADAAAACADAVVDHHLLFPRVGEPVAISRAVRSAAPPTVKVTARAYEFALIVQPLKLKGATGSAVAPMAVR